jgi:hypothetical protein
MELINLSNLLNFNIFTIQSIWIAASILFLIVVIIAGFMKKERIVREQGFLLTASIIGIFITPFIWEGLWINIKFPLNDFGYIISILIFLLNVYFVFAVTYLLFLLVNIFGAPKRKRRSLSKMNIFVIASILIIWIVPTYILPIYQ